MPLLFIDFRNVRYHFCSADVIGSKPVFVTTEAAAGDARMRFKGKRRRSSRPRPRRIGGGDSGAIQGGKAS
jgi:hypothetical protein